MSAASWPNRLVITLKRGLPGKRWDQRATVQALGLRKREHTVERANTPSIRGMVNKVKRLVEVETRDAYSARLAAAAERRSLRPPLVVQHEPRRAAPLPTAAAAAAAGRTGS
eukprot:jgi/Mesen1/2771/ME000170S01874